MGKHPHSPSRVRRPYLKAAHQQERAERSVLKDYGFLETGGSALLCTLDRLQDIGARCQGD